MHGWVSYCSGYCSQWRSSVLLLWYAFSPIPDYQHFFRLHCLFQLGQMQYWFYWRFNMVCNIIDLSLYIQGNVWVKPNLYLIPWTFSTYRYFRLLLFVALELFHSKIFGLSKEQDWTFDHSFIPVHAETGVPMDFSANQSG